MVRLHTNHGAITLELDQAKAPLTVANFLSYVDSGHYSNTLFHRVIDGFMVQGGGMEHGMKEKATQAPVKNEANNGLKNRRGTIAMARLPEFSKSATSQFFFNLADNQTLDHKSEEHDEEFGYCVFGEIIDGLEVIDEIAKAEVRDSAEFPKVPVQAVRIESVRRLK